MPWSVAIDPIAIAGGVFVLFRIFRRFDRSLSEFKEDWNGTPERPGVPARAGVMERLARTEVTLLDMRGQVEAIKTKIEGRK